MTVDMKIPKYRKEVKKNHRDEVYYKEIRVVI